MVKRPPKDTQDSPSPKDRKRTKVSGKDPLPPIGDDVHPSDENSWSLAGRKKTGHKGRLSGGWVDPIEPDFNFNRDLALSNFAQQAGLWGLLDEEQVDALKTLASTMISNAIDGTYCEIPEIPVPDTAGTLVDIVPNPLHLLSTTLELLLTEGYPFGRIIQAIVNLTENSEVTLEQERLACFLCVFFHYRIRSLSADLFPGDQVPSISPLRRKNFLDALETDLVDKGPFTFPASKRIKIGGRSFKKFTSSTRPLPSTFAEVMQHLGAVPGRMHTALRRWRPKKFGARKELRSFMKRFAGHRIANGPTTDVKDITLLQVMRPPVPSAVTTASFTTRLEQGTTISVKVVTSSGEVGSTVAHSVTVPTKITDAADSNFKNLCLEIIFTLCWYTIGDGTKYPEIVGFSLGSSRWQETGTPHFYPMSEKAIQHNLRKGYQSGMRFDTSDELEAMEFSYRVDRLLTYKERHSVSLPGGGSASIGCTLTITLSLSCDLKFVLPAGGEYILYEASNQPISFHWPP